MARELTMNGNAKLKTIMKEFNDIFPFLQIAIFPLTEKGKSTQTLIMLKKPLQRLELLNHPNLQ